MYRYINAQAVKQLPYTPPHILLCADSANTRVVEYLVAFTIYIETKLPIYLPVAMSSAYSSQHLNHPGGLHPRQSSSPPSGVGAAPAGLYTTQQTLFPPALVQRINDKKEELENLIQLRELSAALAQQMEQLGEKLSTLADGTQGKQQ